MTQAIQAPLVPLASRAPILRAQAIRKTFKMGDSVVQVLKNVDLALQPGEFVAIEGRSGSGKSTLLHILGALEAVDGGSVSFDNQGYTRLAREDESGPVSFLAGRTMGRIVWATLGVAVLAWVGQILRGAAIPGV